MAKTSDSGHTQHRVLRPASQLHASQALPDSVEIARCVLTEVVMARDHQMDRRGS